MPRRAAAWPLLARAQKVMPVVGYLDKGAKNGMYLGAMSSLTLGFGVPKLADVVF
jgi:hypothetical protein